MKSKVCVTGLGVISSIGHGVQNFWNNLIQGQSGVTEIDSFNTALFSVHLGGEVKDFDAHEYRLDTRKMGRCSQLAVAATQLALKDANLSDVKGANIAVILGTTLGETQIIEEIDRLWLQGEDLIPKELILQFPTINIANNVSNHFGLKGVSIVIPNACAAGNFAIAYAYDLIQMGRCDVVIAGGADAMSRIAFTGFSRIFAITPDKCQPFDVNRKGIIVGEGAGILILESFEHARRRSAKIYCNTLGYGLSSDANNMAIPAEDGIYSAMSRALEHSKIRSEDVDYVCAHGTGTRANDSAEAKAISRLFGTASKNNSPPVSSIKSMLGHTMGAASAIESIACVLSIRDAVIPPTINLEEQDSECDINCVANAALKKEIRTVLNNAFAFGGNNSCIVFERTDG